MKKLRVLDLFSGIGGFSLGLERTGGFETVAFCEIEEFPRRVLAKHWPEVPCYHDVRDLTADTLRRDGIAVDVICGGFPCQDISLAGDGAGLDGERSGLWSEFARLIGELGPRYVLVENVAALLSRGLDRVLRDLASLGYNAEWHCIPASALGAPHRRDRIWIVGYAAGIGRQGGSEPVGRGESGKPRVLPEPARNGHGISRGSLANADRIHVQRLITCIPHKEVRQGSIGGPTGPRRDGFGWWSTEPNVGRVANGIPDRAHRLKGLGNAVVPQIPELIGRAILESRRAAA